ncbi:GNAT family N-acetyltransferase [Nonomuraea sediminis]|uniref:GNAT family N-acetyltransferase n=1 Tax=Nonomuraea sediminis TaxID=2835864 RepID=UPI001BDCA8D4|nr:GNAT family N-acetyltransferase [Nonomuraea sediminis]
MTLPCNLPLLGRVFGRRLLTTARALGAVDARHPAEPHWYLAVLGTDPAAQGQGLGRALLESGLARSDATGLPAYLETTKEQNVPFYERFGFHVRDHLTLPTNGPHAWLMWRPAQ